MNTEVAIHLAMEMYNYHIYIDLTIRTYVARVKKNGEPSLLRNDGYYLHIAVVICLQ